MAGQPTLSQKYEEVTGNLNAVNEALGRIDERVGIFIDKINTLENKIDNHIENCSVKCAFNDMVSRVSVLESKNGKELKEAMNELKSLHKEDVKSLYKCISQTNDNINEIKIDQVTIKADQAAMKEATGRGENKWKIIGWSALNILIPIIWVTIASVILYNMGITSPPTP